MTDVEVACLPIAHCWVFAADLVETTASTRLASKTLIIQLLHSFSVATAFSSNWTLMRHFVSYLFGLLIVVVDVPVQALPCKL